MGVIRVGEVSVTVKAGEGLAAAYQRLKSEAVCQGREHVFLGERCQCGGRMLTREVCNLGHEHMVERGVVPVDDGSLRGSQ